MECGGDDLLCQVATWVSENEFVAGFVAERFAVFGTAAGGIIKDVAYFVKDNIQSLVGAFGVAFGAWRWWKYRELILHKRLTEYISESDKRLIDLEEDLLRSIYRPGPGRALALPMFAGDELRSVLRERNWDRTPQALTVQQSADSQLSDAIAKLERQISSAQQCQLSLERQSATAHIGRGVIASIATRTLTGRERDLQSEALEFFREALKLDARNPFAKELEGHQLRKLGQLNQALDAFAELQVIAGHENNERARTILISRAMRYQAEVRQQLCEQALLLNPQGPKYSSAAYRLVSVTASDSAISLRKKFEPFHSWDLLEQADTCWFAAYLANKAGYSGPADVHLRLAERAYERLVNQSGFRRAIGGRRYFRLRKLAKAGLERTAKAQATGEFDVNWLGN